jgi:hypothetical protein
MLREQAKAYRSADVANKHNDHHAATASQPSVQAAFGCASVVGFQLTTSSARRMWVAYGPMPTRTATMGAGTVCKNSCSVCVGADEEDEDEDMTQDASATDSAPSQRSALGQPETCAPFLHASSFLPCHEHLIVSAWSSKQGSRSLLVSFMRAPALAPLNLGRCEHTKVPHDSFD